MINSAKDGNEAMAGEQIVKFTIEGSMKSCPFCGKWEFKLKEAEEPDHEWCNWIACENCGVMGPGAPTPLAAIEIWNKREGN